MSGARIKLIYGGMGTGKTTLLADLVNLWCDERLFYVVDQTGDWGRGSHYWRGAVPPLHEVHPGQAPPDVDHGVIVFYERNPREVAQMAIDRGNVTYVDDEIDISGARLGWQDSPLRRIVHHGRHILNKRGEYSEVCLMGACRRPVNVATDLSELAEEGYVFRLQGKNTLDRLIEDNKITEAQRDLIETLPNFQCIHWPSGERFKIRPLG